MKDWVVQYPVSATTQNGAKLSIHKDDPVMSVFDFGGSVVNETKPANGMVIAEGPNPDNETYTLTLRPGPGTWHSLGLEVISDDRLPGARLARGSDRLVVTEVQLTLPPNSNQAEWGKLQLAAGLSPPPLVFTRARSNLTFWDAGLTPWNAIDGKSDTGWGAATYRTFRTSFLALDLSEPLVTTANSTLIVTIRHDSTYRRAVTGRFRLALAASPFAQPIADRTQNPTIPGLSPELRKALETKPLSDEAQALLDSTNPELAPLWTALSKLESEKAVLRFQIPQVVATAAGTPSETRILGRGNFLDDSGPIVEPAVPVFLGKAATDGLRATRLDLANWLVSPKIH
jgi:hypothetical protein